MHEKPFERLVSLKRADAGSKHLDSTRVLLSSPLHGLAESHTVAPPNEDPRLFPPLHGTPTSSQAKGVLAVLNWAFTDDRF